MKHRRKRNVKEFEGSKLNGVGVKSKELGEMGRPDVVTAQAIGKGNAKTVTETVRVVGNRCSGLGRREIGVENV